MHGDELGAIGKGRLDLDVVDHFGDPLHHHVGCDDMRARFHEVSNAAPVARTLHHEIGDERDGFRVVQLDAARQPVAGHHGGERNE